MPRTETAKLTERFNLSFVLISNKDAEEMHEFLKRALGSRVEILNTADHVIIKNIPWKLYKIILQNYGESYSTRLRGITLRRLADYEIKEKVNA